MQTPAPQSWPAAPTSSLRLANGRRPVRCWIFLGLPKLGVEFAAEHIVFGARTTWSEVLAAPLPRGFDGLKAAAREVGSVQIQNAATIAGNLCNASPAADGVAALLALDAELVLTSRDASRTLPLSEFILGNRKTARRPDELLTSIRVPRRVEHAVSTFLKLGARRYLVISIVMVAANLVVDRAGSIREALICVGSCSAAALRLSGLERALVGRACPRPGLRKARERRASHPVFSD